MPDCEALLLVNRYSQEVTLKSAEVQVLTIASNETRVWSCITVDVDVRSMLVMTYG